MDPVQALILKLMEGRAAQDRGALNPTSDPGFDPGAQVGTSLGGRYMAEGMGLQPPMSDFEQYGAHLPSGGAQAGPVGTGPGMPSTMGPEDLIAQLLGGGNLPQR